MKKFYYASAIYFVFLSNAVAYYNNSIKYYNEDGSYLSVNVVAPWGDGRTYTEIYEVDVNNKILNPSEQGRKYTRYNYAVNGKIQSLWHTTYQTLNYDDNGNIISILNNSGKPIETYKYDSNGKMLVYNSNGKLIGAFNNFWDRKASTDNYYQRDLSLLDSDGNYTEKDNSGRIIGIYSSNGDITSYKYDGGGNIIAAYINGKKSYMKRIYTFTEAAAAVHDGNDNIVSITW